MGRKDSTVNQAEILGQIRNLMSKTDVEYTEEQLEKLATLVVLLCKWNTALNLTAIREPEKIVVLHILDSAVISPFIKEKNNIADVGTGAGFPGLVLAILNPEKKFTLIDSIAKKLSFVRTAMTTLGLKNATIINDRCENIVPEDKFECILSRAFAPLCKIVEWCENLIAESGVFICMKANLEDNELNDLPKNAQIESIIDLKVPSLDANRKAVILKLHKA